MDAFGVLGDVLDDYQRFVEGFLNIKDNVVDTRIRSEIHDGLLWPKPWLALNPAFQPGGTISDLIADGLLAAACRDVFKDRSTEPAGSELALHKHQRDAIEIARRGESYVLTTGTGSGKSLAYIVPIVDRVLREGGGKGVQAIVVYPMNALANSQVGELEKFLGREQPKVTFARYTGQENRQARDQILAKPPDILLTNYVMLELMLVRPREREQLIRSAQDLKFLVLDELHTYRGRQGADVAMLIRRLRQAVASPGLQCVGTSATLAGPGTALEQRIEVAALASKLFGANVPAENIVGETLRRATKGPYDPARLAARIRSVPAKTFDELAADDLAVWIEQTFGLDTDPEGRLTRQKPTQLVRAAERLAEETGIEAKVCAAALESTLLAGANARDASGRTLFAFKLHQFIGKGDTAYVTLESRTDRYLTTQYQRSNPHGPTGQPLFPLAFCRECGQDYLVVSKEIRSGDTVFTPRLLSGGPLQPGQAQGLLLLTDTVWPAPEDDNALLDFLPDDWIVEDGDTRHLDKARKNRLPERVRVDSYGSTTPDGLHAVFFETLHFCPECKTTYENPRQSEFSRVASLGTEGRASAVTVISQSVVRRLRSATDLPAEARKFLAFSDNRQDASLQAGHFNDFVLVGLIRSALYRAARRQEEAYPNEPLNADDLGGRLVDALNLSIEDYAQNPDAEFGAEKKIKRAMRESVTYRVYADLKNGWRITMPNLEQTGQLVMDYDSLEEIATKAERWVLTHPALAAAGASVRASVMKVLLDEMRRHLCIETPYLTEERYTDIKDASQGWLRAPWALTDERGVYAATCYPGKRRSGGTDRGDLYLSGLGGFGRWLRRPARFAHLDHKLSVDEASLLIEQLLAVMAKVGLLHVVEQRNRPTGYRVEGQMLLWRAGPGEKRAPNPLRGAAAGGGRVNQYFKRFYAETANELAGLEAREHTAQVRSEDRRDREERFGDAKLPVLYCSPTMELGVDIKSLNVVGMRNVPPTPANYAQRSGRAGRSGQPAVVLTYCATGNAHDNYYFSRSHEMVAGVVAPPRLELANQDLVRAHANAIWLVASGLDLKASMVELLDVDAAGQPLTADVKGKIASKTAVSTAQHVIAEVLGATSEVVSAAWWRDDWIDRTLADAPYAFERALDRWRGLYRDALSELDQASTVLKTIGADEPSKRRARGQLSEARAALDLLKGEIDDVNQGDFYTYRYFASEGFLPGYSFPRLPLAAFIPAEKRTRNNGQGDYVQRPRFLAISEFGPGAFIYHEGARYEVIKVTLPAREDGTGVNITEIKRCDECGYLHEGNGPTSHEVCEQCERPTLRTLDRLMRLLAVKTRRRDRINADEEERQRAGYEIVTSLRFEPHGERSSQQTSHLRGIDGRDLAELTYGDTALIRRMNVGLRRRKIKSEVGYLLDTVDGKWVRKPDELEPGGGDGDAENAPSTPSTSDSRVQRVVPYVEDHRNALLVRLPDSTEPEQRMAVMYALKRAIEAQFQLEDNELAAEPLPGRDGDHAWKVLLFFEAAEGGAGVLRRLATEHGRTRDVARRALSMLHFDPDSGDDLGKAERATEPCAQACYDCLLSYGNQWEHQRLDRHLAKDLLLALRDAELVIGGAGGEDRALQIESLSKLSNGLENKFLKFLDHGGYRLPDQAQETVDGLYVRPDFAYRRADVDAAIFVDGPHHDHAQQKERDDRARKKLSREGWLVLRFHHEDIQTIACGSPPSWQQVVDDNPGLFGTGRKGHK